MENPATYTEIQIVTVNGINQGELCQFRAGQKEISTGARIGLLGAVELAGDCSEKAWSLEIREDIHAGWVILYRST
jgi:hypothetical protein